MRILKQILKVATILVATFYLTSCEDDFNTIGSDLIDVDSFENRLFDDTQMVVTQNSFEKVQTNNLPANLVGVYNDAIYGQTTSNLQTQVSLQTVNPTFGQNVQLDSVVLTVPYFSRIEDNTVPVEERSFVLDSVYGNQPIKLSIIRSNFFLRSQDPNGGNGFEGDQLYFSNQQEEIENNLTNDVFFVDDMFVPSNDEIILVANEPDVARVDQQRTRLTPRFRVSLDEASRNFFKENIIDKEGDEELRNNVNFRNFFRGIYFKAEALGQEGNMTLMNFNSEEANIVLYYKSDAADFLDSDGDGNTTELVTTNNTFTLSLMSGIKVNTFSNPFEPNLQPRNIYLKGNRLETAELNLFSDAQQLDSIRNLNWLINEANLTFFVNQELVDRGEKEPERIFIYDINNNTVLLDYLLDQSNTQNPVNSRPNHLGRLTREPNSTGSTRDDSNRGVFYKIRLTQYINNIINNDSTNVRLALSVSSNVQLADLLVGKKKNEEDFCDVPVGAILSPEGTVLHSIDATDEDKKLKLRIFYTDTN